MTTNITHLHVYGIKKVLPPFFHILFLLSVYIPTALSFIFVLLSHSLKVIEDPVCLLCASTGCWYEIARSKWLAALRAASASVCYNSFFTRKGISDRASVVLHNIFARISDTEQHSVAPRFAEKKRVHTFHLVHPQIPSPKSSPDGLTPNDSKNDPKTNFGNFRETSSTSERDTHPQPTRTRANFDVSMTHVSKTPICKNFTTTNDPSDYYETSGATRR
jgi:hypothetical protein